MPASKRYWCPNGCGKKVYTFTFTNSFIVEKYMCRLCKQKFKKEEVNDKYKIDEE